MFSINTDYIKGHDSPEPFLRQIAEAGFSHVHWVHHWKGDFLYSSSEIAQIDRWLTQYGLKLNDLHASEGREKFWLSTDEYARLAGVELVKNRLDMTAQLGGDAIVMHIQPYWLDDNPRPLFWDVLQRSLDVLLPYAQERNVKIAFENLYPINHETLKLLLARYSPDTVGICYDPGHGNMVGGGLDFLEEVKDRLIVLHLNDNDGSSDQHKLLFSETVDWVRMAQIIATSSYNKPLGMEVVMKNMEINNELIFLTQAMETCVRFSKMVTEYSVK
ncbi:MAG: sugar phosphate isomerase/epimerase [Chloroflexi bacterium]|nr:sugar phosphate isomerase/epimerase [Chloroflexota bacterium]